MKTCGKCGKEFSGSVVIGGKKRNLQKRKYCLACTPFGTHNTVNFSKQDYRKHEWTNCERCGKVMSPFERLRKYCANCSLTTKRFRLKAKCIQHKGGKCMICGYKKCISALEFHHRIPSEKEFAISSAFGRDWFKIAIELEKCDLLCANCHREVHAEWDLQNIPTES